MRKLHLVGLTTDRDGLIFTARRGSKSGGYVVPLDDKILDAVAEARSGRNGTPDGVDVRFEGRARDADRRGRPIESSLTPREMQARLRAGRSIQEVAAEAGVDTEWVARFAVPILAEQAQVVELARGLTYAKPRLGESAQPLGASVMQNLFDRGVFLPDDLADAGWSAFQLHDSVWLVRFRYRSRNRDQEAQWEVDVPTGRVLARNRHASDLGYVEAGRRRRSLAVDEDEEVAATEPPPRRRPTARAGRAKVTKRAKPATSTPAGRPVRAGKTAPATKTQKAVAAPATARTRATPPRPSTASLRPAPRVAKTTKAAPARAVKQARPVKGTARAVKAGASARSATAKAPTRRRPAKGDTASEVGPAAGTGGGVRLAAAKVSTARVAASMATADRTPWAAAVRSRPGARPSAAANQPWVLANGDDRSRNPPTAEAPSSTSMGDGRGDDGDGPAFKPRPLPDGVDLDPPRARRPAPPPQVAKGEPRPVVLPARRVATGEPPILPERPRRRRLRSR